MVPLLMCGCKWIKHRFVCRMVLLSSVQKLEIYWPKYDKWWFYIWIHSSHTTSWNWNMVRHKAIRINDGQRMMIPWKEDMLEFYELNHPKYFLCGTRFLMDTQGALSPRLGHQILWNRTFNLKGGKTNLEMDLQMEFYNKEFKGLLIHVLINWAKFIPKYKVRTIAVSKNSVGESFGILCRVEFYIAQDLRVQ